MIMEMEGMDVTFFSPHSTRAANMSRVLKASVPLPTNSTILSVTGWSHSSAFLL